jgi:hypothetical protein
MAPLPIYLLTYLHSDSLCWNLSIDREWSDGFFYVISGHFGCNIAHIPCPRDLQEHNPQPRSAPHKFDHDIHTLLPTRVPCSLQLQCFNRQKFSVMPLMTSSAGAIIYSALLTKSAVTGCYEAHPGVLRNKISTQQSSWMEMALEDGGGAAMALEDGGRAAALGGGVGWWLKIAAVALGVLQLLVTN